MMKTLIALFATLASTLCLAAALDINQATEAELDSIKGIGPGTSSKILAERKSAKFKDWSDFITRVKGIGDKKAAQYSEQGVTVNGVPFKTAKPAPSASPRKAP